MIKRPVLQEDMTVFNMCALNSIVSNCDLRENAGRKGGDLTSPVRSGDISRQTGIDGKG